MKAHPFHTGESLCRIESVYTYYTYRLKEKHLTLRTHNSCVQTDIRNRNRYMDNLTNGNIDDFVYNFTPSLSTLISDYETYRTTGIPTSELCRLMNCDTITSKEEYGTNANDYHYDSRENCNKRLKTV